MSFAVTSVSMQAFGAVQGAFGSYYSAAGQKSALGYQADLSDINARLSENQANATLLAGQRQEQSIRLRGAAVKGAQRASMAANGIDLGGSNTAQNILSTTDYMKEVDANTAASNALSAAWGYRTQALNYRNDALMKRATADGIDPGMAAFGSLLSGAGKVAGNWYTLNKAGAFDPTDVATANKTDDPIESLGKSRGWWSK